MSMAQGTPGRTDEAESTSAILRKLRELAQHCRSYALGAAAGIQWSPPELRGYADSTLTLSVYKSTTREGFAADQAAFMVYLGTRVCPEILIVEDSSYCMKYLRPAVIHRGSLVLMENLLKYEVWKRDTIWMQASQSPSGDWRSNWEYLLKKHINVEVPEWALEPVSVIHGDPTCDNLLRVSDGSIRISDPIPPHWLGKPSIRAVDYGKIMQSFLGWEVVMRGIPFIDYDFPQFMRNEEMARRAVFWAMVALKRIAYRNKAPQPTEWAIKVAKELETLCM